MAETRSIEVDGINRVIREFKEFGTAVDRQALTAAHRELARRVVESALPHVPVRSGRLKATVKALASPTAARGKIGTDARSAKTAAPYAAAVHWGTGPRPGLKGPHNIERNPFLQHAVWHVGMTAVDEYARAIQTVYDRFSGRR